MLGGRGLRQSTLCGRRLLTMLHGSPLQTSRIGAHGTNTRHRQSLARSVFGIGSCQRPQSRSSAPPGTQQRARRSHGQVLRPPHGAPNLGTAQTYTGPACKEWRGASDQGRGVGQNQSRAAALRHGYRDGHPFHPQDRTLSPRKGHSPHFLRKVC